MFENLQGKKVLIIGGIGPMADLVTLAHRNGVKVGVADYNKGTYLKKIADYSHDINVTDVDKVVELCNNEHYDGVISNFNDMLSPFVSRVAEKCGFYSPYTEEQLLMSTNKKYFKKKCLEYGVSVPAEYYISSKEELDKSEIVYPVIIKPVDGSGSKGISICKNKNELLEGYDKAISDSRSKDVIVEQYIEGDEINVTYIIQNGDIQLAAIHDRYFNTSQPNVVQVPDLYIYPSRYTDVFVKKFNNNVINMLKGIGLKNGSLFMQACVKDDIVYIYEAGMRLNGCKTYQILEYENKYNTFEHLLCYALTGNMGEKQNFNPYLKKWYATVNVLGIPGETIDHFLGINELESYPWLIHIARQYYDGETIPATSAGTLIQDTTRIHLLADTKDELIERINKVNELYKLINPKGENVILKPHDTEEIRSKLNYEL